MTRPLPNGTVGQDNVSIPSQRQKQLTITSKRIKFKTPAHRKSTKRRSLLSMPKLACIFNLLCISVPATAESTLRRSLHSVPTPCWSPVLQPHEKSSETACSYWAQDLQSSAFSFTGQAETLDPFQRGLAHQLLPQQPNNSDADLAKLPHCKGRLVALQAVHSPDTNVSCLRAPSIIKSKSTRPAQRNKDGLQRMHMQRRRLTNSQMVLPWQAALMVNLDVQISNPSMSLAKKQ